MSATLYSVPTSPSCGFVRSVAKYLNVNLCVKNLDFSKSEHLTDDFAKLNPFRKVPTLDDHGFVVHESTAIAYYLLRKHAPDSKLYPDCPKKRARIDQILATVANTIRPHFVEFLRRIFCDNIKPSDEEKALFNNTVVKGLQRLIEGPFAVGDQFTLADLCIIANLSAAFTQRSSTFFDKPTRREGVHRHWNRGSVLMATVVASLLEASGDGKAVTGNLSGISSRCKGIAGVISVSSLNGFVDIDDYPFLEEYYDRIASQLPYFSDTFGKTVGSIQQRFSELTERPLSPMSEESVHSDEPMNGSLQ
ncbi:hypothetical protein HPB50_006811 [Hyalomma asiaticum]|uniref:Uncharacterized protein n=1 Tax=Hyalomma asiaticum TaxID=266040 RepID=A0ACB7TFC2_HYAAI|nr:hypothetical protein HPB50_006811 [Hyalomma asiaticum]